VILRENRSPHNTAYCRECGDFVWAFRPDRKAPDEWFAVAEGPLTAGVEVAGGQCETCGLNAFTIEREGAHGWVAVCTGMTIEGDRHDGCGARHPVRPKMAKDVIFWAAQ
jgi:hypothetical protein